MNDKENEYKEQARAQNVNWKSSEPRASQQLGLQNPSLLNQAPVTTSEQPIDSNYLSETEGLEQATSDTDPNSTLPDYIAQNVQASPPANNKEALDINELLSNLKESKKQENKAVDIEQLLNNQPTDIDPKLYEEDVPFEDLKEGVDYVVLKKKETLYSIAAAYENLTIEQIKQWNPKAAANATKLPVGGRILISGSAKNRGKSINTIGRLKGAKGQDASLYAAASTTHSISTVGYGAQLYIEKTDVSNSWYYVSVGSIKGWIQQAFVTTNIPPSDPNADLYYVSSGQRLEDILKDKGYPSSKETSYWHYGRAASLLNPSAFNFNETKAKEFIQEQNSSVRGKSKMLIDQEIALQLLYNSLEIKANYHIWLPSVDYTEQAKKSGAIESRSDFMQGVIDVAEGVESFMQGAMDGFAERIEEEIKAMQALFKQLVAFTKDILKNAKGVIMDFWRYIKKNSIEQLIKELLEGLVDPMLKIHLTNALNSLNSGDVEQQAKLWGLAAGTAIALGAIMVITRGGGKFLKKLQKISPKLGGIFDEKMAMTTPDGHKIQVSGKDGSGFDNKKQKDKDGKEQKPKEERKYSTIEDLELGDIDDFIDSQKERLNTKLGKKVGQGRLPFDKGLNGVKKAIESIRITLNSSSEITNVIPKEKLRGNFDVVHIYSKHTNNTVSLRVLENGKYEFDTLISGKSSKFNKK